MLFGKMNAFNNFNNLKLKLLTLNFNHFHKLCNNYLINVPKIVQIKLTNTNDYFNDLY